MYDALRFGYLDVDCQDERPTPRNVLRNVIAKADASSPIGILRRYRGSTSSTMAWPITSQEGQRLREQGRDRQRRNLPRLCRVADRDQCQLGGSQVAGTATLMPEGRYAVETGHGPDLNLTETAVAQVLDPSEISEVIAAHYVDGGDYLLVDRSTASRPFLHKLCISLLRKAVEGTGKILAVTMTFDSGPGVLAVFHDVNVKAPQAIRQHEAELNARWSYLNPKDLVRTRDEVQSKMPRGAWDSLVRHWRMAGGEVHVAGLKVVAGGTGEEGDNLPEVTASVLLRRGHHAYVSLLASEADTTCSTTFRATYEGEEVMCEVRLRAHSSSTDQQVTRAHWCGSSEVKVPTQLNPARSRFLDVNGALACLRPRNWGTLNGTLLLGSTMHALLTNVVVHRQGKTSLSLSYSVSYRGADVTPEVVDLLTGAFSSGNVIRFNIKRRHVPSTSPSKVPFPE